MPRLAFVVFCRCCHLHLLSRNCLESNIKLLWRFGGRSKIACVRMSRRTFVVWGRGLPYNVKYSGVLEVFLNVLHQDIQIPCAWLNRKYVNETWFRIPFLLSFIRSRAVGSTLLSRISCPWPKHPFQASFALWLV